MKTEETIFDYSGQRQVIKKLSQGFPDVAVTVFSAAFIIESVDLGNLSRLVVSSQDDDSVFVSDFEGNQQSDSFNTVMS